MDRRWQAVDRLARAFEFGGRYAELDRGRPLE